MFFRLISGENTGRILLAVCAMIIQFSCTKFVQVPPPTTSLVSASVYSSDASASAAVTGIYQNMLGSNQFFGSGSSGAENFTSIAGLSADEFSLYPGSPSLLGATYTNALTSMNVPLFWNSLYNCIYTTNSAITGLTNSNSLTSSVKKQLLGEAKFARAFCNFYLVNIYGDVPLVITPDYRINAQISRAPKSEVYEQIISDLTDAQNLLSAGFVSPSGQSTTERTLPNKDAATALLARTYLYLDKYDSAALESSAVINNSLYSLNQDMDSVFLMNSTEAIWQLQPVSPGFNTPDGYAFILSGGPNNYFNTDFLSPQILSAFEPGDDRKTNWVAVDSSTGTSYFYPFKYKVAYTDPSIPVTEYYMILRLAEQYLIRAEAEAELGQPAAVSDLNIIRSRAGLPNYTGATDQTSLLNAIYHENQVEFFCEWGHRWLDLKRTGTVDAIMQVVTPQKGGTWVTTAQLFPLPIGEIQTDPNLVQNPGYN